MQIKGCNFLLTFCCPARCNHCSYRAGPERIGKLDLLRTKNNIKTLVDSYPLESIYVHGGEPFLFPELLKSIIQEAKEFEVPRRGVITNGYWAMNRKIAERTLSKLKEAGLTHISFSVDSFHQEFIQIETVITAIKTAIEQEIENIYVNSYYLSSIQTSNYHNKATSRILERLGNLEEIKFSFYPVRIEGRGAELLTRFIENPPEIPTGQCPFPFWIGGDFKKPETIEIDPDGNVTLCPGLCIGNTESSTLLDVLKEYDYSKHPIISILVEEGPIGLLSLAESKGYKLKKDFVSECHLCYEMRRFLRPNYQQLLTPLECYY